MNPCRLAPSGGEGLLTPTRADAGATPFHLPQERPACAYQLHVMIDTEGMFSPNESCLCILAIDIIQTSVIRA